MNLLQSCNIFRRGLVLKHSALALLFLAMLSGMCAQTQPLQKPLSKDDVVKLLTGSVSPKRVGELARERGIDFQLTPEVESQLRNAGGDDGLLSTLRQLAAKPVAAKTVPTPSATLVVNSSVGGARVYVDDLVVGDTSSQGRLKIPNQTLGQHQVRVSLEGYQEFEETIELLGGETYLLPAKLEPHNPRKDPEAIHTDSSDPSPPGTLVFIRQSRWEGGGAWARIYLNGEEIAQLQNGRYFVLAVQPGKYRFESQERFSSKKCETEEVEVGSGVTQYLEWAFTGRGCILSLTGTNHGKTIAARLKPLDTNRAMSNRITFSLPERK